MNLNILKERYHAGDPRHRFNNQVDAAQYYLSHQQLQHMQSLGQPTAFSPTIHSVRNYLMANSAGSRPDLLYRVMAPRENEARVEQPIASQPSDQWRATS